MGESVAMKCGEIVSKEEREPVEKEEGEGTTVGVLVTAIAEEVGRTCVGVTPTEDVEESVTGGECVEEVLSLGVAVPPSCEKEFVLLPSPPNPAGEGVAVLVTCKEGVESPVKLLCSIPARSETVGASDQVGGEV